MFCNAHLLYGSMKQNDVASLCSLTDPEVQSGATNVSEIYLGLSTYHSFPNNATRAALVVPRVTLRDVSVHIGRDSVGLLHGAVQYASQAVSGPIIALCSTQT